MANPLESKHIAPLYRAITLLDRLVEKGCASFGYNNGVQIYSESFAMPLVDSRADELIALLGGADELEWAKSLVLDKSQAPRQGKESCVLDVLALLAWRLKGWRKGPFTLASPSCSLHIDSEWQSYMKWDLLAPFVQIGGAKVADVGCNNGFYMFAMYAGRKAESPQMPQSPQKIVGFDPSGLFYCQFAWLNHLLDLPIGYELLGVQDLPAYVQRVGEKFDVIFCLGVLYHRSDVFATLKSIAQSLETGGVAFIDTLIFDINDVASTLNSSIAGLPLALSVRGSYAKMSNVYLLPNLSALEGWCERCGFESVEVLAIVPTTTQEQRKTRWIDSLSLENFLDPNDSSKTIEGYPAPKRAYIKVRRK